MPRPSLRGGRQPKVGVPVPAKAGKQSQKRKKKYEIIDHTADIGLRGYGQDLKELFRNTALGMFSLLVDTAGIEPKEKIKINSSSLNREELLVSWLSELLYFSVAKQFLFRDVEIKKLDQQSIESWGFGESLDLSPPDH